VIQGSNFAECHPVGFRWVMEAKRRGAKVIHVDPRFTRTSAVCDLHVPIRPGTDIAFLGGLIRHVLENERYFREYVVHYTNAATILREDYQDTEDLDGLFSGYEAEGGNYDTATWQYEGVRTVPPSGHKHVFPRHAQAAEEPHEGLRGTDVRNARQDPTLEHPRCVLQVLRRHFQRYTPARVAEICGVPEALLLEVAEALCESSGRERTSAFCYSVGWTQHSVGVQYIRTASILQLLLGNIGRPGGGILALRGHASIQGSTDIPTLFNLLPGYLPMPHAALAKDLAHYIHNNQAAVGAWYELPAYMVSLLKAWYGPAATRESDHGFSYLPRMTGDHGHMATVADMADGRVEGYLVMGENPAVGSPHAGLQRAGLRRLKWLVVRDLVRIETAEFWRASPEHERGEVRAEDIETEVFFFPAAAHTEKDGAFTNTHRLLQWHHKAVEPPEDCRSELWFAFHLGLRLKALYAGSKDPKDRPIQDLTWDYPTEGAIEEPVAEAVLREINGYRVADGAPVEGYEDLADDGSTAAGCWLYSGCYAGGINRPALREPRERQSWVAPRWGWAWPMNRRMLYNRASADPEGRPWSERKRYLWWDEAKGRWTGPDEADFILDRHPGYRPPPGARGLDALGGAEPFIMQSDGKGWLFAPNGIVDGPLPAHYEPEESPVKNALYGQQCNPMRREWRRPDNPYHRAWDDPRFPYVLTTYRLTEHHTAGGMSRWLSWLSELMPVMFCEVSPELAAERGLENGGFATVITARGEVECRVLVTRRLKPLVLDGRRVHLIGLPYHFGAVGRVSGDAANELLGLVEDSNVGIMESKALTGDIVPGRKGRARRMVADLAPGEELPRDLPGVGQPYPWPTRDKE
jgi:formate dehydrogenase major subunit